MKRRVLPLAFVLATALAGGAWFGSTRAEEKPAKPPKPPKGISAEYDKINDWIWVSTKTHWVPGQFAVWASFYCTGQQLVRPEEVSVSISQYNHSDILWSGSSVNVLYGKTRESFGARHTYGVMRRSFSETARIEIPTEKFLKMLNEKTIYFDIAGHQGKIDSRVLLPLATYIKSAPLPEKPAAAPQN